MRSGLSITDFLTRTYNLLEYVHTEGGGGWDKSARHAYKGEEADTPKYVRKKVPFCMLRNNFGCKVLSSYFVV